MSPTQQKTMVFENKRIRIYYKTKEGNFCFINPDLIKKQKLTWLEVQGIIKLRKEKDVLFTWMYNHFPEYNTLKKAAKEVTKIEYKLQKFWHFKKNRNFHRFWELPHCTCPKLDNEERLGTKYHIISEGCIYHGSKF